MNFTRWTAPPPSCGTAASVRCVEAAGRGLRVASPRLLTLFLPSGRPAVPRCAAGGCGGQLAGSLWAAFGLGIANKLLEPQIGAVLGKILILALIILFIQKRPQGLFALKGRVID